MLFNQPAMKKSHYTKMYIDQKYNTKDACNKNLTLLVLQIVQYQKIQQQEVQQKFKQWVLLKL